MRIANLPNALFRDSANKNEAAQERLGRLLDHGIGVRIEDTIEVAADST
jgi:hypothetical protein